jgi:hypothetical protein
MVSEGEIAMQGPAVTIHSFSSTSPSASPLTRRSRRDKALADGSRVVSQGFDVNQWYDAPMVSRSIKSLSRW